MKGSILEKYILVTSEINLIGYSLVTGLFNLFYSMFVLQDGHSLNSVVNNTVGS